MSAQMDFDDEMSDDVFYERLNAMLDAFACDDFAKARKIAGGLKLPPKLAMQRRSYMSKEDILALGYDMSLVEAKYGKDWYEAPETVEESAAPTV